MNRIRGHLVTYRVSLLVSIGFTLVLGLVFALVSKEQMYYLLLAVGVYLSVVIGLLWHLIERGRLDKNSRSILQLGRSSPEAMEFIEGAASQILEARGIDDSVFQEMVTSRIEEIQRHLQEMASGRMKFGPGESWRAIWRAILLRIARRRTNEYWSVAWVKTPEYWGCPAGQESFEFARDLEITKCRVYIIRDACMSDPRVQRMVRDDFERGIDVRVIREALIQDQEPRLIADFGIYGNRAVGYQDLDEKCGTKSFTFLFSEDAIRRAQENFRDLLVYATPAMTNLFLGGRRHDPNVPSEQERAAHVARDCERASEPLHN